MRNKPIQSVLVLILLFLFGCDKIKTVQESQPILFKGLKSVESSTKDGLILLWDQPPAIQIVGFQIYIQDLTGTVTANTDTKLAASGLRLDEDANKTGIATVLFDLPDSEAPVTKGKLLQVVSGELNSFEIEKLLPGNYALQVRAIAGDGRSDSNPRVMVLTIDSSIGYEGISKAELQGSTLSLEWPALQTNLKGQDVNYTVFEGPAFSKAVAITTDTKLQLSLRGTRPGTVLSYGVRSTDPKGRTDRNTKVLSVTIPDSKTNFEGCSQGEARGADRIRISFIWPEEDFETFKIYRNGAQVYATRDKGVTEYNDVGLQEGEVYQYSCVAELKDLVLTGSKKLTIGTLTSNAPTFKGIRSVELNSAHSGTLRWGVSTGVPSHKFLIYLNPGSRVNWENTPIKEVAGTEMETEITALGDDLQYAFGVRACSIKSVCDSNEITLLANTRDDGAPLTQGAQSLLVRDGGLKIMAPWTHSMGGISKRFVYIKKDGDASTNLADYVQALAIPVSNPAQVPTEITYTNIQDNTTYHVIVRDQDPSGRTNTISTPRSIFSGDTTAPNFVGVTSILSNTGALAETTLRAHFTAGDIESSINKYGIKDYIAYVLPGGGNACGQTTVYQTFPSSMFPSGTDAEAVITGLTERTLYGVCIKARDTAGNISNTTLSINRSTLDTTAPNFDGVNTPVFNKEKGVLTLTWNASSASDVYEYQVLVWKSNPDPTQVPTSLLKLPQASARTGTSITKSTINLNSGEDVYVLVNACDNAGAIVGGSQNCSNKTAADYKMITLPDIEPPTGFLGIKAEPDLSTPAQGSINVAWIAPNDWTDYKGFKVYLVNEQTNLLEESPVYDCPCADVGCSVPVTSCLITGLDAYRSYIFHVRAYDAVGNITQLDPSVSSTKKRSSDTTAPSFSSSLSASYGNASTELIWVAATDNQYANEPGAIINYEVWRKTGTTFSTPVAPTSADSSLMLRTEDHRWIDPGTDYTSGQNYFYTICAVDASGNRNCDGNVKSILTPDLVPPVIGSFTSSKTDADWSWSLNWTATDNATAAPSMFYRIYAKQSANAVDKATKLDDLIHAQAGVLTATNLQGPINTNTYIHYLLVAEDADQNQVSKTLTVYSNNLMSLASVRSTEGVIGGGNRLVLVGDGFKTNVTVSVGASNCSSLQLISRKHILCTAPAGSVGDVNVTVSNPDGSSAMLSNAYHYCDANVSGSCTNICNRPSAWGGSFAKGAGMTLADPYIICSASHLNNLRSQVAGRFYALGANIDLNGLSFNPITNPGATDFQGTILGNNYIISNFSYTDINSDFVGLFKILNFADIRDLGLINFTLSGRNYVGALAGAAGIYGTNGDWVYGPDRLSFDGIFSTGTVSSTDAYAGGIMGRVHGNTFNMMSFANVSGRRFIGGLFGRKIYGASNLEYSGTVLATGNSSECYAGGIAGHWSADSFSMSALKSSGSVTCRDDANLNAQFTGGLIGQLYKGSADQISSTASVTGRTFVGGLIGEAYWGPAITNASFAGSVTGRYAVGGILGQLNQGSVTNCTNDGLVSVVVPTLVPAVTGADTGGGIIGRLYGASSTQRGLIKDCVNLKAVSSPNTAGGMIGYGDNLEINHSSSAGDVTATGGLAGGLVGQMRRGLIVDSFATGNVSTSTADYAGGLVGAAWADSDGSTITNSRASGSVTGHDRLGGLIGYYRGEVTGSSASGAVTGNAELGGLIGFIENANTTRNNNLQSNSSSSSVTGDTHCGGLYGRLRNYSLIKNSYATGTISCPTRAGGVVALIEGDFITIQKSMSRSKVTGNSGIGGFVGYATKNNANNVTITDCYARGNVKGNDNVGGFAGIIGDVVQRIYATGRVEKVSSETNFGGLIGNLWNPDGPRDAPNSFWDLQSTSRSSSKAGVGKNTSEMLGSSLYSNWDASIWSYSAQDYPRLLWELPSP